MHALFQLLLVGDERRALLSILFLLLEQLGMHILQVLQLLVQGVLVGLRWIQWVVQPVFVVLEFKVQSLHFNSMVVPLFLKFFAKSFDLDSMLVLNLRQRLGMLIL